MDPVGKQKIGTFRPFKKKKGEQSGTFTFSFGDFYFFLMESESSHIYNLFPSNPKSLIYFFY
jgi:hypothetical protein